MLQKNRKCPCISKLELTVHSYHHSHSIMCTYAYTCPGGTRAYASFCSISLSLSLSHCSYRLLEPGALLWCQGVCLGYHWDDVHLQMIFQIMLTIPVQLLPNMITACLCMLACSILWCRYECRPHIAGIVVGY